MYSSDETPDQTFLQNNNYDDPTSSKFGQSALATNQMDIHRWDRQKTNLPIKSNSWVSFLFLPLEPNVDLMLNDFFAAPLSRYQPANEWITGLPHGIWHAIANSKRDDEGVSGGYGNANTAAETFTHTFQIRKSGEIEFIVTNEVFDKIEDLQYFRWVTSTGYFSQLIYLVKDVYRMSRYSGETRIVANFINTTGTRLLDFAPGRNNQSRPLARDEFYEWALAQLQCVLPHLQIQDVINLSESTDQDITDFVKSIATRLGKYYSHDEPLCYDQQGNFPVVQFIANVGTQFPRLGN